MKRAFAWVILPVLWVAASSSQAIGADGSQRDNGDDSAEANAAQDIFYLGEERLVAIRYHLYVDGLPYRTAWLKHLEAMFDLLDIDDNKVLTGDEHRGIPSRSLLENFGMLSGGTLASRIGVEPDAGLRDGTVTRQEFDDYFERVGLPPFRIEAISSTGIMDAARAVRVPQLTAQDEAPRLLLKLLDADQDAKLGADEFRNATRALRRRDLDRDESISVAELSPFANPFGSAGIMGDARPQENGPTFIAVGAAESRRANLQQLLKQYDGRGGAAAAKNGQLSAQELGWEQERFGMHDVDGSGQLDFEEIQQLLSGVSPHHEITARIGKKVGGGVPIERRDGASGNLTEANHLALGSVRLELATDGAAWQDPKRTFPQLFRLFDRDNNGYADAMEWRNRGLPAARFTLLDADADGKLFVEELETVMLPLFQLDEWRLTLRITDRGRDLFRVLDTSGDGRIGPREFRIAAEGFSQWDVNDDGAVELDEIPQQYRLFVTRSTPNLFGNARASVVDSSIGVRLAQARSLQSGPAWFYQMDRNTDGDVSQAEFLGTSETFDKLDVDGDGLLDRKEAAAKIMP